MIDFLLLRLTALFCARRLSPYRCALGAALGALSSLIVFVPDMTGAAVFVFGLITSAAMTAASFYTDDVRKLPKPTLLLFCTGSILSGVFTLIAGTLCRERMAVYRGVVYFDIGLPAILCCVTAGYLLSVLLSAILLRRNPDALGCILTVITPNGSRTMPALIDTGSSVTEPFSGEPVIICDSRYSQSLIPKSGDDIPTGARLVPFKTLGGSGVLTAFRSIEVTVRTKKFVYRCEKAFVAFGDISCEDYGAVINPALLERAKREEVHQ